MDNNTLTSASASAASGRLLEQERVMIIRSLLRKEGAAADADAGVIKDIAKEGMALNIE
jgi:hypothetical protein